jgi:ribose transport system permease protein
VQAQPTSTMSAAGIVRHRLALSSDAAQRAGIQALGIGTFYVAIVAYFWVAAPAFGTTSNFRNIIDNSVVVGIVALGQTLVLISGGFDLSVSGVVPLAGVAFAMLGNDGVPIAANIAACVAIGAVVGIVNGLLVTVIQINPLIATLGTLSITTGVAFAISDGVTQPFNYDGTGFLGNHAPLGFSNYTYVFFALAFVGLLSLRYSVYGQLVYSRGGSREASRLAGIRVDLVTNLVYAICGMLAAVGGIVVATQLLAGTATAGTTTALDSISAAVIGGAALSGGEGGIVGTLIGVLVITTIANGLAITQVPAFYQQIATGAVLLLAVGFSQLRRVLTGRVSG